MNECKRRSKFLILLIVFIYSLLVFNYFIFDVKINIKNNESEIQISNGSFPIADFTADPRDVVEGEIVQFTFTGEEGDPPATYYWDFGDGSTSPIKNPTHQYDVWGSYTIDLTVTDVDGDNNTVSKEDYIYVIPDFTPIVTFTANTTSVKVGHYVQFLFTGSSPNTPNKFSWSFGDFGTSAAENPKHRYDREGEFTVSLGVMDKQGDHDELVKENYIIVYPSEPKPSFPSYNSFIIIGMIIIISSAIYSIQRKQVKVKY